MKPIVIVRYGELTTKSRNRIDFIQQLKLNVNYMLQNFSNIKVIAFYDRMEVTNFAAADLALIIEQLQKVFGISSLSPAFRVSRDITQITTAVCQVVTPELDNARTFKLFVKRGDKNYPLTSMQITKLIAMELLQTTNLKVNVINPDLEINIKINDNDSYLYITKIAGVGGMPVGTAGKVLLLLSGGIDSPVAAYKLMRRGLEVEYLHFATPPFTSDDALAKVKKLVSILAPYNAGNKKLLVCNFTNLQNELTHITKPNYRITIMRRMFMRLAQRIAVQEKIMALATGEALGQVASQTLASLSAINDVASLPILRSLICEDKSDIISIAKKIGTYETSILPFADCCSLFVPDNPITQPKINICQLLETQLMTAVDWTQILINIALDVKIYC